VDIDTPEPFSPELMADPYPAYHALRERGRVHRSGSNGAWLVTGYQEVRQVLTDARFAEAAGRGGRIRLSRSRREGPERLLGRVETMLSTEPPEHTRLRRLVSKAFTPRSIEDLRPRIQEIVDELLDAVDSRQFDLVGTLAWPLPVIVIAEMLGIPREDRERFKRWSDAMIGTLGGDYSLLAEARRSNEELVEYVSEIMEARRRSPRKDLISGLVAAEEQGAVLSDDEILGTIALLLVAGNETTTHLISGGVLALLRHPREMQRLRDEASLIPSAVEEFLRFSGPVHTTRRSARTDVEINGVEITRGEVVIAILAAANRDPNKYADPDRLDVARNPTDHVAFGDGIHFCLGAPLARVEAQIAIGSLLNRFPRLALANPSPEWGGTFAVRGVKELRLSVTPELVDRVVLPEHTGE
jgi:cytochrome P450